MSGADRRRIRLNQWATRAADHINGVSPARADHLGYPCDYARTYMGHRCRCGHRPVSWSTVYAHAIETLKGD